MSNYTFQEDWHSPAGHDIKHYTGRWTPAGRDTVAYVVFCHGFMEHIRRYDAFFSRLAEAGISIFAYDQRGFGRTAEASGTQGITSTKQQLDELDYYIQREATEIPSGKRLFLWGHSMGGAAVLSYLTATPRYSGLKSLAGAIVSSPLIEQADNAKANALLIRAGSWIGAVLPSLQLNVGVASEDISRDPEVRKAYAEDPLCPPVGSYKGVGDMLLGGKKLLSEKWRDYPKEVPILLYHGSGDRVTAFDATKSFEEKIVADDKKFICFDGYFHEPHNEPGDDKWKVMREVESWITAHV